jgi:uncharacterized protein Smg (DUF494 family)
MYDRIIEILIFVLSELTNNKDLDEISIAELTKRGYTNEEITTAFTWIVEQLDNPESMPGLNMPNNEIAFRVLNETETELFNKETWGEIINLKNLGMLSNENIEALIDWAVLMGIDNMTKQQLSEYLAFNVFKFQKENNMKNYVFTDSRSIN